MVAFLSLCCVILRQSGLEMLALASGALPSHLRQLRDAAPFLRTIVHPDVERICALFDDNDGRDEDDRRRFSALYGADPILDYRVRMGVPAWLGRCCPRMDLREACVGMTCFLVVPGVRSHVGRWLWLLMRVSVLCAQNPSLYDCIIDTTRNQSRDTFRQAVEELSKRCTLPPQSKL